MLDGKKMGPELPKNIRPVPSCPQSVVSMLSKLLESQKPPEYSSYHQLWIRLCCDMDMRAVWDAVRVEGMTDLDFVEVAMVFVTHALQLTEHDYSFEKKTNSERRAWLKSTRDAALRLKSLLAEGPGLSSENVIERIPMEGMRWFLGGIGVRIVPGETSHWAYDQPNDRWVVSERTVSRMQAGTYPLSLHDLLEMLIADLDGGVPSTQTISKPRDSKAFRANYILGITQGLSAAPFRLTDEQVCTVARVILRDEAITPALANRFRWRAEKDTIIGP